MAAEVTGSILGGEIRLGEILQLFGFIAGGLVGALMLGRNVERVVTRVEGLEAKVDKQSEEIAQFGKMIEVIGRYEERFTWILKQIDDLRRGIGLIHDPRNHRQGDSS